MAVGLARSVSRGMVGLPGGAVVLAIMAAAPLISGERLSEERPRAKSRAPRRIASNDPRPTSLAPLKAPLPEEVEESATGKGPLAPVLERLADARTALESIRDYACAFSKREVVSRKLVSQQTTMKFRQEPFSVYMLFGGAQKGREVLFVDGRNANKLLVHETNVTLLGSVTVPLAINAPEVTRENRYPITDVGLHRLADVIHEQFRQEARATDVTLERFPSARLEDRDCEAFRATFAQPAQGRKFHQTVAYFDKELNLLVRIEQYGFPRRAGDKPGLLEEYSYTRIETNVGLTDRDFDPRNREYHFQ